jgi:hypothetical protein
MTGEEPHPPTVAGRGHQRDDTPARLTTAERRAGAVLFIIMGASAIAFPLVARFHGEWLWFLPGALVLGVGGLWAASLLRRQRYDAAFVSLVVVVILGFGCVWQIGLPMLERGKSAWQVAQALSQHYGPSLQGIRVGRMGYKEVSIAFYLRRPVPEIPHGPALNEFLTGRPPAVAIMAESRLHEAVKEGFSAPYQILWKERVWIPEKFRWVTLVVIAGQNS